MSFDLNLTTPCDHRIFRELTVLDSDARTLTLEMPVAAEAPVKVYATENIVPPGMYTIANDDLSMRKIIKFKDKWKSPTDYFETTYVTLPEYCSKCSGIRFIDDISYNVKGDLLTVRDEKLLMQNVEKFTVTRTGSNSFHAFVGTGLVGLIGSKITNAEFLNSQIKSEETRTLQKLQELQTTYQATGRTVTKGELLKSVENIQVTRDADDPTIFRMDVAVMSVSGKTVEFTQYLKVYS